MALNRFFHRISLWFQSRSEYCGQYPYQLRLCLSAEAVLLLSLRKETFPFPYLLKNDIFRDDSESFRPSLHRLQSVGHLRNFPYAVKYIHGNSACIHCISGKLSDLLYEGFLLYGRYCFLLRNQYSSICDNP